MEGESDRKVLNKELIIADYAYEDLDSVPFFWGAPAKSTPPRRRGCVWETRQPVVRQGGSLWVRFQKGRGGQGVRESEGVSRVGCILEGTWDLVGPRDSQTVGKTRPRGARNR